jgi:hypothetical protein
MKPDRKQMMEDHKMLMREFRQVRQAMYNGGKKGKDNKDGIEPMDVFHELIGRIHDVHKRKK